MEHVPGMAALERVLWGLLMDADLERTSMNALVAELEGALPGCPAGALTSATDGSKQHVKKVIQGMLGGAMEAKASGDTRFPDADSPERAHARDESDAAGGVAAAAGTKAKRSAPRGRSGPAAKSARRAAPVGAATGGAVGASPGGVLEALKRIAKQMGVVLPWPRIARAGDTEAKAALATDALVRAGLRDPLRASARQITEARKKRELERELDGIDATNILSGGRRRRAPVAYWEGGSDSDGSEGADAEAEGRGRRSGGRQDTSAAQGGSDSGEEYAPTQQQQLARQQPTQTQEARKPLASARREVVAAARSPAGARAAGDSLADSDLAEENFAPPAPKHASNGAAGPVLVSRRRALIMDSDDDA